MDGREVAPQPVAARTRWGIVIAVFLLSTLGGLWLTKSACEENGNTWFWLPVTTGGETDWGCVDTDD
jgi:hypothetical protein